MTTPAPATERKRIAQAAFDTWNAENMYGPWLAVADYILAREAALREECAKVADSFDSRPHPPMARDAAWGIATAIRAGAKP